jgi:hypothetical protein
LIWLRIPVSKRRRGVTWRAVWDKTLPNKSMTRIDPACFFNGYTPAKKWVIVATIANPQSRDFKR